MISCFFHCGDCLPSLSCKKYASGYSQTIVQSSANKSSALGCHPRRGGLLSIAARQQSGVSVGLIFESPAPRL